MTYENTFSLFYKIFSYLENIINEKDCNQENIMIINRGKF